MSMPDQPDDYFRTSQTLMWKVRHAAGAARNEAWSLFMDRYAPIIRGYARKQGLAGTDVDDLIQETFTSLLNFEYDPAKGRFRGYLKTCVINSIRRLRAKRHELPADAQPAAEVAQAEQDPFDQLWEAEQLRYAMELVRDHYLQRGDLKTYRAFEMQTIQELPPTSIAEELKITVESVYQAKSRVLSRLRKTLETLEQQDG
jgi:RNA polymerase sigma-70 factor, ECF subfamily